MALETVAVCIGSDDTQIVPALVCAQSLLRSPAGQQIKNFIMQADSGRLLLLQEGALVDVGPLPMRPQERPQNAGTRFSLARFVIPEVMRYQGRAIYFDSDQICLGNPSSLLDILLGDNSLAACTARREVDSPDSFDTSVMVIDCSRCHWRIRDLLEGLRAGAWAYWELMCLSGRAAPLRCGGVTPLDPIWNTYDTPDSSTQILHYTTKEYQPWKNDDHPSKASRLLWETEFVRALHELPMLGDLVQQGVRDRYLKPGLLSLR